VTRDYTSGEVGNENDNVAVGKGQQQVHIDLGNKSTTEIAEILRLVPRLSSVIFGDGYNSSIVDDLRDVKRKIESLDSRMKSLETNLSEVHEQTSERRETSNRMQALLFIIMLGVILLVVLQFWKG
jgi:Mg2+ and Co2+ transporter CorA